MLAVWFGSLPAWMPQYRERVAAQEIDWLFFHDLAEFKRRVKKVIGINCPIVEGGGKIHDFRAAFGALFKKELRGYDWWGHTDMDCVYGRLDRFYGPKQLDELDIMSDHIDYICGPWTLYRNTPEIANIFREHPDALDILELPESTGWVEKEFTQLLDASGLRVRYERQHSFSDPQFLSLQRGRLTHFHREVPFHHFRYTKEWPLS